MPMSRNRKTPSRRIYNSNDAQGNIVVASPTQSSCQSSPVAGVPTKPRDLSLELASPPSNSNSTILNLWMASPALEKIPNSATSVSVPAPTKDTETTNMTPSSRSGGSAQAPTIPDGSSMESESDLSCRYKAMKERANSVVQDLINQYKSLEDDAKSSQSALATAKQSVLALYLEIKNANTHYVAARDKVTAYDNVSPKLKFTASDCQSIKCLGSEDMANMVEEAYDTQQAVKSMLADVRIGDLRKTMFTYYEKGTALDAERRDQEELVAELEDKVAKDAEVKNQVEKDLQLLRCLSEQWRA